jgi:hypothetical protein
MHLSRFKRLQMILRRYGNPEDASFLPVMEKVKAQVETEPEKFRDAPLQLLDEGRSFFLSFFLSYRSNIFFLSVCLAYHQSPQPLDRGTVG